MALVHRRSRGEHPGADVRDAGQLEQALDGPVLAVRAVQDREHDVDVVQQSHRLLVGADVEAAVGRIPGEDHMAAAGVDRGEPAVGDPQPLGPVGLDDPAPLRS